MKQRIETLMKTPDSQSIRVKEILLIHSNKEVLSDSQN